MINPGNVVCCSYGPDRLPPRGPATPTQERIKPILSDSQHDPETQIRFLKNLKICQFNNIQSLGLGEQGPTIVAITKLDQLRTIQVHEHNFDVIVVS